MTEGSLPLPVLRALAEEIAADEGASDDLRQLARAFDVICKERRESQFLLMQSRKAILLLAAVVEEAYPETAESKRALARYKALTDDIQAHREEARRRDRMPRPHAS